ncbi:hypothetical protein VTK56DRAFT_3150 [Thermocarpiscus australiensis]
MSPLTPYNSNPLNTQLFLPHAYNFPYQHISSCTRTPQLQTSSSQLYTLQLSHLTPHSCCTSHFAGFTPRCSTPCCSTPRSCCTSHLTVVALRTSQLSRFAPHSCCILPFANQSTLN